MSAKESYTSDEWSLLRSTPAFVSAAVAAADPGGVIGALQEATAGASAFAQFAQGHAADTFLTSLADDKSIPAMPDPQSLLGQGDSTQQAVNFQKAVLQRAQDALAVVAQKGTPQEAADYKALLNTVADQVANAATEGGFLGLGGVRVSEKEKSFLAALAAALDSPRQSESPAAVTLP